MSFIIPPPINIYKKDSELYNSENYKDSIAKIESFLLPALEASFNKFVESNLDVIQTYLYWKDKLEEIQYRTKPHFTLSIAKNRETSSIVAKVKWKYQFKGKLKKSPYISVYIGSLKQYPKGLKDTQLFYDAPRKVQEYINRECPLEY